MNPQTSKVVLVLLGAVGWALACVFGVFACMVALDGPGHDLPWFFLGALVLGLLFASVPVGAILWAAYVAFRSEHSGLIARIVGGQPDGPATAVPPKLGKPISPNPPTTANRWRWFAVALLASLEALLLPVTITFGMYDDDWLVVLIPLNLVAVLSAVIIAVSGRWIVASRFICAIHLAAIAIAGIVAAFEVESVIISGPLLAAMGLAVAFVGDRPRIPRIVFGLSTVAFCVVAFLVIAIGQFGPNEADAPLFVAMTAYQLLVLPLGLYVVRRTFVPGEGRLQFGLGVMLAFMLIVCVATAGAQLAANIDDDFQLPIALGLALLNILGIVAVVGSGSMMLLCGPAEKPTASVPQHPDVA